MEAFTSKERKKEFEKQFKEKILPFFKTHGFQRHTKTSKRLFKEFENQLSVFIFFEYKSFGAGFYDMTISYFDEEMGTVYDDNYIAMANVKSPSIVGSNTEELGESVNDWLQEIEREIIPFIENHSTHKAILASKGFCKLTARKEEITALLERKSLLA